jgi:hypothetical protein
LKSWRQAGLPADHRAIEKPYRAAAIVEVAFARRFPGSLTPRQQRPRAADAHEPFCSDLAPNLLSNDRADLIPRSGDSIFSGSARATDSNREP